MSYRTIWTIPGTPWSAYADHATEEAAHRHALAKSVEIGGEVAVVRVGEAS